jgi:AraC-like DNA-binding protein
MISKLITFYLSFYDNSVNLFSYADENKDKTMPTNIVVVRASHGIPMINYLKYVSAPLPYLLAQVALSEDLFENPDNLIPEHTLYALLENASLLLDMPDIGFKMTEQLSLDNYGTFGAEVMEQETLNDALLTFIATMGEQSNCPPFWLAQGDGCVWFCRIGSQGLKQGHWQVEQHVVSLMIELVRSYTSAKWTPPFVYFQTNTLKGIETANSLINTRINSNMPITAVCIPNTCLNSAKLTTNKQDHSGNIVDFTAINVKEKSRMIASSNKQIIKAYLLQLPLKKSTSIDDVAKTLGMNIRQLQRLLQKEDISFRQLSDEVIFELAKNLLNVEQRSILEVSCELGYTEASNFSRAFTRWSGISPTKFRVNLKTVE